MDGGGHVGVFVLKVTAAVHVHLRGVGGEEELPGGVRGRSDLGDVALDHAAEDGAILALCVCVCDCVCVCVCDCVCVCVCACASRHV